MPGYRHAVKMPETLRHGVHSSRRPVDQIYRLACAPKQFWARYFLPGLWTPPKPRTPSTAHQSYTSQRTCTVSEFQSIRQKFIALDPVATPSSLPSSPQGLADVISVVLSACFVRDAHFPHNGGSHMHVSDARGDAGSGCLVRKV